MTHNHPNILYIHSHDTGQFIQPYGYNVPTPNLQRLAESGVLFRNSFTPSPTCSPSRACLLTGQYPHNNGMLGLAHRGFSLYDYKHHVLHTLKSAGYTAVLSGVQHIARKGDAEECARTIGYDRLLTGMAAESHTCAVDFIKGRPAQPFFLSVGFFETHRSGALPEGGAGTDFAHDPAIPEPDARYVRPAPPFADTPETRRDMALYMRSAATLDRKMGAVLAALEESGLADNTLVIGTTDHGIAFPRMKCNLEDSGTKVMLIIRDAGDFSGGKVVDGLVSNVDVFPTLCDYLGLVPPDWLEGRSVMPLVRGEKTEVNEDLFFEINYHAAYEPMRAVRTNRWKYIRRFDPRPGPVLCNCDASITKQQWMEAGWQTQPPADEALYDLVFDPNETCNLMGDPRHAAVADELRGRLAHRMRSARDPLALEGDVPLPPTARCNPRDSVQPGGAKMLVGER